jgi:hypothetical protein
MSSIILLVGQSPTTGGCVIFHHWVSLVVDAELAKGQHTMSSKEKKLWEQAIWILKQNSVTVGIPAALQAPAEAPKRAA